MAQLQKSAQPGLLARGERLNAHPAVGTTEGRGDGDDDHLDQVVAALGRAARVVQRGKMTPDRSLYTQVAHRGDLPIFKGAGSSGQSPGLSNSIR